MAGGNVCAGSCVIDDPPAPGPYRDDVLAAMARLGATPDELASFKANLADDDFRRELVELTREAGGEPSGGNLFRRAVVRVRRERASEKDEQRARGDRRSERNKAKAAREHDSLAAWVKATDPKGDYSMQRLRNRLDNMGKAARVKLIGRAEIPGEHAIYRAMKAARTK